MVATIIHHYPPFTHREKNMKVTQVSLIPSEQVTATGRPALTPVLLAASGARYPRNNEVHKGNAEWRDM